MAKYYSLEELQLKFPMVANELIRRKDIKPADVAPVVHANKILRYYDLETGRYIPKEEIDKYAHHGIKTIPFCGRCGVQLGRGWKYCANCGAVIDTQETHKGQ